MIFNRIGVDGQPKCKTIWGTPYICFIYHAPKWLSYLFLSVHLIFAYINIRFVKPEGVATSSIGYPIQLVWRLRPEYSKGRLRCRYCFEYKYEENGFKKL
jgi:hypothetical protein